ncbi:hypothetical protein HHL24_17050 [Paraburkholderia sp. RP-4-7]|uniref:Uncharacterized protein n=1 Tax=Paraburkholderia polaris TaxID=2728848 RepID=A0A848IJS2_9BURK|nr:hypothetical protein [Paraburkholderia polaris]NML99636.1 hypothetical protein [Paraburkholderia polaris]
MNKPTPRYEQTDFGLKVIYVSGTVSVVRASVCQNPVGEAAVISERLYALTNLLTGPSGAEAFDNILSHEQQSIFEILHSLAAETAALSVMARDLDCGFSRDHSDEDSSWGGE